MFNIDDIFSPDIIEQATFPAIVDTQFRCIPAAKSVAVAYFPEVIVNQCSTFLRFATVDFTTLPATGQIVVYQGDRLRIQAVGNSTYRDTFRLALTSEFDRG